MVYYSLWLNNCRVMVSMMPNKKCGRSRMRFSSKKLFTGFLLLKTNITSFWDLCVMRKTFFYYSMVKPEFSCSCYFSGDQPRGAFPLQFGSINVGMMNGLQVCPHFK